MIRNRTISFCGFSLEGQASSRAFHPSSPYARQFTYCVQAGTQRKGFPAFPASLGGVEPESVTQPEGRQTEVGGEHFFRFRHDAGINSGCSMVVNSS